LSRIEEKLATNRHRTAAAGGNIALRFSNLQQGGLEFELPSKIPDPEMSPEIADQTASESAPLAAHPGASMGARPAKSDFLYLAPLTVGALLVHGYHGEVEDAEIYLPGVLKHLHPELFPKNAEFFNSHAGMTLFPALMAGSIRALHLPVGIAMLLWQVAAIFGLLWACLRIGRVCFPEKHAAWCGVALVASLLTLPVAGTALYIMDPYVTARALSTPASLLALASLLERRYRSGALWILFTAAVHPLMSLFLLVLAGFAVVLDRGWKPSAAAFGFIPLSLFPPLTPAYETVLRSHPYFLLSNWEWYEWLGIFGPLTILAGIAWYARGRKLEALARLAVAAILFETVFVAASMVISMPNSLARFAEIQPMRSLLLVYILMFVFAGGLLARGVLKARAWRWAVLFVPLCAGMAVAQVQLLPDSSHLEWPWDASRNSWAAAFEWIQANTPRDAYFALDPDYEKLPGEDIHGFRAIAQRSMLADNGKDSGAVSMFPALAAEWSEQVQAHHNWKHFERADFLELKARYGVDWVVLQVPGVAGLTCPYKNDRVVVCSVR
jgi:hypothetical protein